MTQSKVVSLFFRRKKKKIHRYGRLTEKSNKDITQKLQCNIQIKWNVSNKETLNWTIK